MKLQTKKRPLIDPPCGGYQHYTCLQRVRNLYSFLEGFGVNLQHPVEFKGWVVYGVWRHSGWNKVVNFPLASLASSSKFLLDIVTFLLANRNLILPSLFTLNLNKYQEKQVYYHQYQNLTIGLNRQLRAVIVSNALALLFFNLVSLAGGKKWESRVQRPGLKAWVQKFGHEGLGQGLVPGTNGMVLEAWSWRPGARELGPEGWKPEAGGLELDTWGWRHNII